MSATSEPEQSLPKVEAEELPSGTELLHGQYKIESFLSSGGFGITYLARDSLDRRVVIKECFPRSVCRRTAACVITRPRTPRDDFRTLVRLFIQEARHLARLSHPNIVGVHQVFEDNGTAYMALDHIEGRELFDVIEDDAALRTPDEIAALLGTLLDTVDYVHSQGMLHRDISPDNILIRKDMSPVLIDFGAARAGALVSDRVRTALLAVKDGYSPQEFYVSGNAHKPSSDLYALAATFYHVIAGEAPPNCHERLAAVAGSTPDPIVPIAKRAIGYDRRFLEAIDIALAVFPKDRFQSAAAWKGHLRTRSDAASDTSIGYALARRREALEGVSKARRREKNSVGGPHLKLVRTVPKDDAPLVLGQEPETPRNGAPVRTALAATAMGEVGSAVQAAGETASGAEPQSDAMPAPTAPPGRSGAMIVPLLSAAAALGTAVVLAVAMLAGDRDETVSDFATRVPEAPSAAGASVFPSIVAVRGPAPDAEAAGAPVRSEEPAPQTTGRTPATPAEVAEPAAPSMPAAAAPVRVAAHAPEIDAARMTVMTDAATERFVAVGLPGAGGAPAVSIRPPTRVVALAKSGLPAAAPEALPRPALPKAEVAPTAVYVPLESTAPRVGARVPDRTPHRNVATLVTPSAGISPRLDQRPPDPLLALAAARLAAEAPVLDVAPVMTGWAVKLPFETVGAGDTVVVAAVGAAAPDWLAPGQTIASVNGVPVSTRDEIYRVIRAGAEPGPEGTWPVAFGVLEPGAAQGRLRRTVVAASRQVVLLNGMRFEIHAAPEGWRTLVTESPSTQADRLRTGDELVAYLPTSEPVDGPATLPDILKRELAAGQSRFGFAVRRDGALWVVSMDYAAGALN